MRNRIRNILICILFILASYQILTFWFDGFSMSNLSLSGSSRNVNTVKTMDFVVDRLIINVGDNQIIGKANGIYDSEYKKEFDAGVVDAVNNGDDVDLGDFSWNNVLKNRAVVYQYNCKFDKNDIPKIFGNSVDSGSVNNISSFDNVIIMVDNNDSSMTVMFFNSENNKYTAKKLKDSKTISPVYSAVTAFANSNVSAYISSEQNGFDIFEKNIFIPAWQENIMTYDVVKSKGMYKDESMAEKNAEDFFDNPVAKWSSSENNSLVYSDENTVVKYDRTTNVFEYSNYRPDDTSNKSFAENYITAVNTINQDSNLINEVYLDSYKNEKGRYTFLFNYKINDKNIIPGDEIKNKTGMDSFVEVTTEDGKIIKYQKYAYYFESSSVVKIADCDFVTAIDRVYSEGKIKNIDLCYVANNNSDITLNWIIDINEDQYITSVERE